MHGRPSDLRGPLPSSVSVSGVAWVRQEASLSSGSRPRECDSTAVTRFVPAGTAEARSSASSPRGASGGPAARGISGQRRGTASNARASSDASAAADTSSSRFRNGARTVCRRADPPASGLSCGYASGVPAASARYKERRASRTARRRQTGATERDISNTVSAPAKQVHCCATAPRRDAISPRRDEARR